jgi:2-polyprenyl-3-methyl-5-hydroxy-6-metoxy-1,4-benzoquinol methylase
LTETFIDLGVMPLCESYVSAERLDQPEPRYPLHAWVCRVCVLVQLEAFATPREIFDEYAYFSSYADSWVEHARRYVAHVTTRFSLSPSHRVIEVASNDGYLLQHFVARGHDVLGIEPAINVAAKARERGIPTETAYLGVDAAADLVRRGRRADLLVANNVLAHVPDLHDFIEGLRMLLAPRGVLTVEIPHLQSLIDQNQFDTIYHEHFSYFSLLTAERALDAHGLSIFDVERLPTHGGSLRIYAQHRESGRQEPTAAVETIRACERAAGLDRVESYRGFGARAEAVKKQLLTLLQEARARGARVAGYGAPGKGNTLLNYCGIGSDLLPFTVDRNPYKQGKYTPGTHVPIRHPDAIAEARPDYLLVLPWNLKDEIIEQMAGIRSWGGAFIVPIPQVAIVP